MTRRWRSWRAGSGVHPAQIHTWKRALQDGAAVVFTDGGGKKEKQAYALVDRLYRQIGQLKVERGFLQERLVP